MKSVEIVLIEDNPGDVLLIELALQENGIPYSLTHFECGSDALARLCEPTPETAPDLILMDLNTPRTDGFATLIKLKQSARLAGVPIAILTSSQAQGDKHRAAIQGARYIEKPSQLAEFLSTVGQSVKEMLSFRAYP
jgi:CheY-like chemotaxis protein